MARDEPVQPTPSPSTACFSVNGHHLTFMYPLRQVLVSISCSTFSLPDILFAAFERALHWVVIFFVLYWSIDLIIVVFSFLGR